MPKLNFNEVLNAILLLRQLEKMPLLELAKQYAEFSKQEITEEMLKEWSFTGLGNEYFLTSDFLQKFDFVPIQHLEKEPVAVKSGDSPKYQIGNYVKSGLGTYSVAAISIDGIEALQDLKGNIFDANAVIINPVPIIEEWLLKFGFEKTYNSSRSTRFDIEIDGNYMITYEFWANKTQNLVYGGKNIKCEFVHELQNKIYALTGVELKISE